MSDKENKAAADPLVKAREEREAYLASRPVRLFRLKVGTHAEGNGLELATYRAAGMPGMPYKPGQEIVASRINLAKWDPNKFEVYQGPLRPAPQVSGVMEEDEDEDEMLPPGPPTDFDRAAAAVFGGVLSPEQKRMRAEQLRQQADALEESADTDDEGGKAAQSRPRKAASATGGGEEDDLDDKTVEELRDLAEGEEVELRSDMRKDEIKQAIRTARKKE